MSNRGPREGEFQITPEEDRFLRAFFRRHAGRYLLAVGALGIAAACAVALGEESGAVDPEALRESHAALEALRAENERLRGELGELAGRVHSIEARVAAPDEQVSALEGRVAAVLKRLARMESALEKGAARPAASAPPDSAGSWDVSAILERLYNLEVRQDGVERGREAFEKDVLNRLFKVESARAGVRSAGGSPALPAAPAP